jgi:hypothetical protein
MNGILGFTELLQEPQLTGKNNKNISKSLRKVATDAKYYQ